MGRARKKPDEQAVDAAAEETAASAEEPATAASEEAAAEPEAAEEPATAASEEAAAEPEVAEEPVAEEAAAEPEVAEEPVAEEAAAEPEAVEEPVEDTAAEAAGEPEAEAPPAPAAPSKPRRTRSERKETSAKRASAKKTRTAKASGRERKPITRLPRPERERSRPKERRGVVVSAAMDKTIVVRVETARPHPVYKKVVRRSKKFHAHDDQNSAKVGDVVRIVASRPLSKTKTWRLAEILEAAK